MEVAGSAAADLKRVHLELGGKAPVIVFDDADIEGAAEAIAEAGYFNAGQDCTAATRVLAGPGVHDDFVAALTEAAKGIKTGMPDDEDVLYGAAQQREPARPGSPAWSTGCPTTRRSNAGGTRQGDRGYFYEPDRAVRPEAGRRADPDRDLRPGHHRPEVQRRGRGARAGPTASQYGLASWSGPRTTAARCGCRSKLDFGVRLDQHPHPVRLRDAARRVQALRLRQGPLDVRPGGLHAHQARDVLHRRVRGPTSAERTHEDPPGRRRRRRRRVRRHRGPPRLLRADRDRRLRPGPGREGGGRRTSGTSPRRSTPRRRSRWPRCAASTASPT